MLQKQVFTNLHNLTKVGGVILNVVPFSLWINHGFYNYNPITFRDLAYANEYKWNLIEDEKTEVLMELTDLCFEELIEEILNELI